MIAWLRRLLRRAADSAELVPPSWGDPSPEVKALDREISAGFGEPLPIEDVEVVIEPDVADPPGSGKMLGGPQRDACLAPADLSTVFAGTFLTRAGGYTPGPEERAAQAAMVKASRAQCEPEPTKEIPSVLEVAAEAQKQIAEKNDEIDLLKTQYADAERINSNLHREVQDTSAALSARGIPPAYGVTLSHRVRVLGVRLDAASASWQKMVELEAALNASKVPTNVGRGKHSRTMDTFERVKWLHEEVRHLRRRLREASKKGRR